MGGQRVLAFVTTQLLRTLTEFKAMVVPGVFVLVGSPHSETYELPRRRQFICLTWGSSRLVLLVSRFLAAVTQQSQRNSQLAQRGKAKGILSLLDLGALQIHRMSLVEWSFL